MTDTNRFEYERRVNRVVDHIHEHLAEALSLETLARVAAFSPFHFHRVFRAITGETLFTFIQRLRLEEHRQAAFLIAGIELTRGAIASSSRDSSNLLIPRTSLWR